MDRYLKAGAHITNPKRAQEGSYEIKELIGTGSSCAVYYAEFMRTSDSRVVTEHLLKEYNPKSIKLERAENGSLVHSDSVAAAFDAGLCRFEDGYNMQLEVRRNSDAKNSTSNIQDIFDANGTRYIDMTVMAGKTYEKVEEKTLQDLLRRIVAITKVVGNYHKKGLLHLDIKPENIFTIPETAELVVMFDFDTVVKKENAATAFLSYTQSWAAQEQILPYRRNQICEATDIFAIGEILFYKLMGRHSYPHERTTFASYSFDGSSKLLEGVNPRIFPLLSEIFKHTICNVVGKRYQNTSELLEKLEEAILLADPRKPFLQHHLLPKASFFIGRDAELREIDERLKHTDKLFISSMGGMGKSELVKQYAHIHKGEYDAVIFSVCNTDLESLILDDSMLPINNVQQFLDEKARDYGNRKLRELSKLCNKRVLIIVDNFNDLQDKTLSKLLQLNCKMLFTTRCDATEYNYEQLTLGTLREEYVWDIFRTWYKWPLEGKELSAAEQILSLYQHHTMAVELIAKQMNASCTTPTEMLAKLNSGGFSNSGRERIVHSKDGASPKQNIYEHIRRLFDVSELSESQVYVLANLSLLPPSGIDKRQFHDWCKLDSYEDINMLTESGWVRQDEDGKIISLHPVVADVMLDELEQDLSICDDFLGSASNYIRNDFVCADAYSRNQFYALADFVCAKFVGYDDFPFCGVEFINLCSTRFVRFGSISKWIRYERKAMQVYRLHIQYIDVQTLVMFSNLAILFHENGQLKTAEKYYHRVLKEASFLWDNRDSLSQTVYNNLATLYLDIGKPGRAKSCLEKAIQQKEALPDESSESLSTSYDNLGRAYEELELYPDAIAAYRTAQEILSSAGLEMSEGMAISYGHLGSLYYDLDDYDNAEIYQKKALKIWQASFGDNHIDTAFAYYDLGLLYREKGQFERALKHLSRALSAFKFSDVATQEDVAKVYSALGKTYVELKNYNAAEECYANALKIRQKLFDPLHPSLVLLQERIQELHDKKN